jgi:membrane-bound lytic murein transglycosylase B
MAAAAGAMLLVPAVVAGEPINLTSVSHTADGDVGRGLMGLTDPSTVSADGELPESQQVGSDVLDNAGNPDLLNVTGFDLPNGPLAIPGVMLQAYQRAAGTLRTLQPGCNLDWTLLASIGRIESGHARGGQVFANGDTVRPILGPVLNGGGFAAIADTDSGRYDGETRWDRAVGAMQFIPSTWAGYAADGNADRVANPHNVFDATVAAGKYLCSGGMNLSDPQQRAAAVFRYNHSDSYVRTVLIWADAYAKGVQPLPSTPVPSLPQQQLALPAAIVPGVVAGPGLAPGDTASTPPGSSAPVGTPSTPPSTATSTSPTTTPTCPPSSSPTTTTSPSTTPSTPTTTPSTDPGCPVSTTPESPTSTPPTTTASSPAGETSSTTGGTTDMTTGTISGTLDPTTDLTTGTISGTLSDPTIQATSPAGP